MKLELQDAKGSTGVFIELPLEQLKEELGLLSSSTEAEAQLKESQDKVGEMETQLKESQGRTMDDFTQMEKANFVIGWAKDLSPEKKAVFAQAVGLPIAGAKVEEVEKVEEVAEVEENPKIIQGKTDKPGYIYYEYLNLSMRE